MNAHPRRVKVAALALTIYTLPGHCWVRVIRASQRPLQIFGTSVGRRMARESALQYLPQGRHWQRDSQHSLERFNNLAGCRGITSVRCSKLKQLCLSKRNLGMPRA